ncbi:conserved hypothetical protein [Leptospira interrogans serovar Manilae]|uniref:Uncharacterized protein n=1 Tax=Leptospira interrogans serovar Manilae TaxID=214675 RepID=A0AAQ1SNX7_LEPIR|nr:hypothetical protein [Leptospira interrogans]EYU65068.1 hypothetical protein CI00_14070 [Leptospira interrogans serovar Manilae]SOR61915.1 conserved hypothetical protein [Leptospira interrogans serovar Manilae]
MVTVNVPLDTGAEYEVIKPFDTFQQHRRYTYVGFISFYDDRTIAGYELFFYHAENDKLHACRISINQIQKEPITFFKRVGGWERPAPNSIPPIDLSQLDLSQGKKLFQLYIPYFKSLIEGEKWIRNWYEWWAENEKLFETVLTRSEYLRWKHFPIQEIEKFLKESSVLFRRSYQYVWLDGNCIEYYLNM